MVGILAEFWVKQKQKRGGKVVEVVGGEGNRVGKKRGEGVAITLSKDNSRKKKTPMLLSSRLLAASRAAVGLRPAAAAMKHASFGPLVTSSSPRRFVGAKAESESKDSAATAASNPPPTPVARTRPGAQAPLKVNFSLRNLRMLLKAIVREAPGDWRSETRRNR